MKTVLITGCCGFIGSHFVDFYSKKDYKVVGFDKILCIGNYNKEAEIYNVNLLDDYSQLLMKVNPDLIIHCAGSANVSMSFTHREEDFSSNVNVLYRLLDCVEKSKVSSKIIFFSSAAVYGNPQKLPIKEEYELSPISPYGLHKKLCEDICSYYIHNENMDIRIVRVFSAYGEGLKKQVLWDMYNKLIACGKLELFGTGNESRDFIHINDLMIAVELICNSNQPQYIYNLANGKEIRICDLANIFLNYLGYDGSVLSFNGFERAGDPIRWKADISKLYKIGYKPSTSIDEGLYKYIKWLRSIRNE